MDTLKGPSDRSPENELPEKRTTHGHVEENSASYNIIFK